MATWLRPAAATTGTLFAPAATTAPASNAPVVNTQPSAQSGVYDTARTYDVGAGVTGALSYAIQTPVTGYSINDSGVVSYDGTRADPGIHSIVVVAYELAGQSGDSTVLSAYTDQLNLPYAAVIDYPPVATAPEGTLKQDGNIDGVVGSTWEVTSIPSGATISSTASDFDGGVLSGTVPDSAGTYTFAWRYWDGSTVDSGGDAAMVTGSRDEVVSGSVANLGWTGTLRNYENSANIADGAIEYRVTLEADDSEVIDWTTGTVASGVLTIDNEAFGAVDRRHFLDLRRGSSPTWTLLAKLAIVTVDLDA